MNGSPLVESMKEDYFSEAYEAFFKAVDRIDLSKVKDENWKVVGYADFYLKNVKSKFRKRVIDESKVRPIDENSQREEKASTFDNDIEEKYQEEEGYKENPEYKALQKIEAEKILKIIEKCKPHWNDRKKYIIEGLLAGKTKPQIAKELGIRSGLVTNSFESIKREINRELVMQAH